MVVKGSASEIYPGLFICLEGGEGVGKTLMAGQLKDWLVRQGRSVIEVEDPGTTPLGLELRRIVKNASIPCDPYEQVLLYTAARRSLAREIQKHLSRGVDVIAGRWSLSTYVYQGLAGGLGLELVQYLDDKFSVLAPDIYILLDADPEIAVSRKTAAMGSAAISQDRFDGRCMEWHREIRQGYLALATDMGAAVVDANSPPDEVLRAVMSVCESNARFRAIMNGQSQTVTSK